jgi:myosin heavy subunit
MSVKLPFLKITIYLSTYKNLKMKQLVLFLSLFLVIATVSAQDKTPKKDKTKSKTTKEPKEKEPKLSKAEKQEQKRKAAELRKEFKEQYKDPEKFKQFKKDNATAKQDEAKMKEEVSRLQKNDATHQEQVESLKQMNSEDETKIRELQEALKKKEASSGSTPKPALTIPTTGTFYAVHIGDANPQVLQKILENGTEIRNTEDHLYILGLYPDIRAAQTLRLKVMEMGLRSANVVTIKNGKLSM